MASRTRRFVLCVFFTGRYNSLLVDIILCWSISFFAGRKILCMPQEKFEASIAKYRSEVKRYKKSCHQLEEQLRGKETELVAREQEMQRAKAASDQLSNAIINFQRVGL